VDSKKEDKLFWQQALLTACCSSFARASSFALFYSFPSTQSTPHFQKLYRLCCALLETRKHIFSSAAPNTDYSPT
jgi:hypothetical protein